MLPECKPIRVRRSRIITCIGSRIEAPASEEELVIANVATELRIILKPSKDYLTRFWRDRKLSHAHPADWRKSSAQIRRPEEPIRAVQLVSQNDFINRGTIE